MSEFTYAEAEVMARRVCASFHNRMDPAPFAFETVLERVIDALEVIERCGGHITFAPPLNPAGGVYGEEKRRNWLTGWLR